MTMGALSTSAGVSALWNQWCMASAGVFSTTPSTGVPSDQRNNRLSSASRSRIGNAITWEMRWIDGCGTNWNAARTVFSACDFLPKSTLWCMFKMPLSVLTGRTEVHAAGRREER